MYGPFTPEHPDPALDPAMGDPTAQAPGGLPWDEKLKNAAMLMMMLAPGAAWGSKTGRVALGAGAGAVLGPSVAEAAGSDRKTKKAQKAAPAASVAQAAPVNAGSPPVPPQPTGDPTLDALQQQLFVKQTQRFNEYGGAATGGTTGTPGAGPVTRALDTEIDGLINRIGAHQETQRKNQMIETPAQKLERQRQEQQLEGEKQKRADQHAAEGRGWLYGGAGVGAAGGAALSLLGAKLTRGRSTAFNKVASDLKGMSDTAKMSRFDEVGLADNVAGGVDEAATLRGMPKPFGAEPEKYAGRYSDDAIATQAGPFKEIGKKEARATAGAVQDSRAPSQGDLGEAFEKPMTFSKGTEWAIPTVGALDYGINTYRASQATNAEDKRAAENLAQAGIGMIGGSKAARALTKPFTAMAAKVEPGAVAATSAARNKLMREIDGSRPPPGKPADQKFVPAKGGPNLPHGKGGGASTSQLQQFKAQTKANRSAFLGNANHQGMSQAINAVRASGSKVTADKVMRELKSQHPAGRIDGVKINRAEVGSWLRTHGYVP